MRLIHSTTLLAFLLLSASACDTSGMRGGPNARTWVFIDPIQCNNNAWDPSGMSADDYYRSLGVDITQMVTIRIYEAVCLACTCPTGDRLFLEIDRQSLNFMIGEGFAASAHPIGKRS